MELARYGWTTLHAMVWSLHLSGVGTTVLVYITAVTVKMLECAVKVRGHANQRGDEQWTGTSGQGICTCHHDIFS